MSEVLWKPTEPINLYVKNILYNIKFKKNLGPWDGFRWKQLQVKLNPALLLLKLNWSKIFIHKLPRNIFSFFFLPLYIFCIIWVKSQFYFFKKLYWCYLLFRFYVFWVSNFRLTIHQLFYDRTIFVVGLGVHNLQ